MKKMFFLASMILFFTLVFAPSSYSIYMTEGNQICLIDNVNNEIDLAVLSIEGLCTGYEFENAIVNCFTTNLYIIENSQFQTMRSKNTLVNTSEVEVITIDYINSNILYKI